MFIQCCTERRFGSKLTGAWNAMWSGSAPETVKSFLLRILFVLPVFLLRYYLVYEYEATWKGQLPEATSQGLAFLLDRRSPVANLPIFYLGMIVGLGCLSVRLTKVGSIVLSVVVDLTTVFLVVYLFVQGTERWLFDSAFTDFTVAMIIFGLYRGKWSLVAKLLSTDLIGLFAPASYCIYLLHPAIMIYSVFDGLPGAFPGAVGAPKEYVKAKARRKRSIALDSRPLSFPRPLYVVCLP